MSSFTNTTNFDDLVLQTLMGRLQIGPSTNQFNSQSLEDLLFDAANLSEDNNINDEKSSLLAQLANEENKLENEVIRIIHSGMIDTLRPNSGQAVTVGDHNICVRFQDETDSDYRVWEWHGHVMIFSDEHGYSPEYIYGNYFERLLVKPRGRGEQKEEEKEEKVGNLGLRELIDGGEAGGARILHRSMSNGSPRF
ncbi:uncharacterized protein LOC108981018 [Juglans regia]|uniref:Uncharacterized protein LOC108981018 n=1 Tax=Juglans regia TaxID=51240 RepID=A0A2I4DKG8_JUGRE|nr:uncharacterized protein LOC108981018 [Juglans regia]